MAGTTIGSGDLPASIQYMLDEYKKTDVKELHPYSVAHSAESIHDVERGMRSGLDAKEIAVISDLDPKKAAEYKKMAESEQNLENVKNDRAQAKRDLDNAIAEYESVTNPGFFRRLFTSKETLEKRKTERGPELKAKVDAAQREYDGVCANVISYETILQRNGGMKF